MVFSETLFNREHAISAQLQVLNLAGAMHESQGYTVEPIETSGICLLA